MISILQPIICILSQQMFNSWFYANVANILYHIQHVCSFIVEPVRTMVFIIIELLKLTIHIHMPCLRSADLPKGFSELFVWIFTFLNIFLNRFCQVEKCGVTLHCLYRDSPSDVINILWEIWLNFIDTLQSCLFKHRQCPLTL